MTASIREASSAEDVTRARSLFLEYAGWLKVDLCFQGFDTELATLPGAYAPPLGRLLLVGEAGEDAFGCIALRPIDDIANVGCGPLGCTAPRPVGDAAKRRIEAAERAVVGEIKRLYVQPSHRRGGWGNKLVATLIEQARAIGYRELKLDTLEWMDAARNLYASHGFRPCAPYYVNPLPGVVYMARTL